MFFIWYNVKNRYTVYLLIEVTCMKSKEQTCCFFGHRKIQVTDELVNRLNKEVEKLITEKNIDTLLFGSKSEFDELCVAVVSELKKKYSHIKRIYVRAEFAHIDEDYNSYLWTRYEETYYPEHIQNSGRAVLVERNYEMIDNSSFCVVYYDENYILPRRKNSKKNITDYQPNSGTKRAYNYALKNGLKIINVFIK